ncbi:MAG: hypothetical protein ACTHQ3_21500 [Motilibacteraceae bacterium]
MRTVLLAGVVGALAVVTACTVEEGAVAGIGVDAQGRPVGYLQVCRGHVDGATVYRDDGDERALGSWTAAAPVTGSAVWSLTDPQPGSADRPERPLEPLETDVTYALYGWTRDNSRSAQSVSFTPAQLAALRPGQVRYAPTDRGDGGEKVVSLAEFHRSACAGLAQSKKPRKRAERGTTG